MSPEKYELFLDAKDVVDGMALNTADQALYWTSADLGQVRAIYTTRPEWGAVTLVHGLNNPRALVYGNKM